MSRSNLLEKLIFDAHYVSDGDIDKFAVVLSTLIVEEASEKIDALRNDGFVPTGFLIRNHFGIK